MTETRSYTPDLGRLTDAADDSFSVRRAYGEPYEHQGQLVIPVAKVWGGLGTGSGGGAGTGSGAGSGQGTGAGKGTGQIGGWSRSFRVGSAAEGGEGGPDDHGDASGDAQGEIRGETHGDASGEGNGGGGGYGLRVKPLGVYVVSAEGTSWQPVLDLNKAILGVQIVGVAFALSLGWALGRRRR
ncbi:hypothetical protein ATJ88_2306 [Isoptericola jiangsuensis]|uniref:Sporulation protein YtfJ n=1 Tax=Isoptericola jiangsuensis TaxID=548579 RepID=A0A2A9EZB1_9MICO|nr:hypothetical protein [Isoptericola jiangsuensis]PFG43600.1 hypothetical protein ATJ88_2306 [Isoptericola jiangsuensis]